MAHQFNIGDFVIKRPKPFSMPDTRVGTICSLGYGIGAYQVLFQGLPFTELCFDNTLLKAPPGSVGPPCKR